jgi:hypothetical protein
MHLKVYLKLKNLKNSLLGKYIKNSKKPNPPPTKNQKKTTTKKHWAVFSNPGEVSDVATVKEFLANGLQCLASEMCGPALSGVVVSLEPVDLCGSDECENFAADLSSDVVAQIQHLLGWVIDSACESADDVEPELLWFYLAITGDLFRVAAGIGLVSILLVEVVFEPLERS